MSVPDLQVFIQTKFLVWIMLLSRISGLFLFSPFLGATLVPRTVKILVIVISSWLLMPYADTTTISLSTPIGAISWMVFINFTIGMAVGLFSTIMFDAVQFAGQIYGYQIGFAVANVLNPQTQTQIPLLSQLTYILAAYLFVSIEGPAMLLLAMANSVKMIPVDTLALGTGFVPTFWKEVGTIFSVGMQIGFPIIAFLLVVTIVLGIMSKIMPQMNVFMVGMPLNIIVGLIMFAALIPVWFTIFGSMVGELSSKITLLLSGM